MKQLRQPRTFADVARQVGMDIDLDRPVLCPEYLPPECTLLATSVGVKSCCRQDLLACEPCRANLDHILLVWWPQHYGTRPPCRCGSTTTDITWRPL
jgi:hypothetical protein